MIKLNIEIDMPKQIAPENKHKDLCQKCEEYMMTCESDKDSGYHFKYLATVYKKLAALPKIPPNLADMFDKLEEFMLKYDIDRTVIDSATLKKHGVE